MYARLGHGIVENDQGSYGLVQICNLFGFQQLKTYYIVAMSFQKARVIPNILKPIVIDYKVLQDQTIDLSKEMDTSFGPNGNGILLIKNIPNYVEYKNTLLPLAKRVHMFPPEIKRKYERPEVYYGVGLCTFEKYAFKDIKDMATSWYCNSIEDKVKPVRYMKDGKEVICNYLDNFWPTEDLPELEPAFKNMGRITSQVGFTVTKHLQKLIKKLNPKFQDGKIENAVAVATGRLVHYHSSPEFAEHNKGQAVYWHSDTSSITTLCSPIYMDENMKVVPGLTDQPDHGLEILRRDKSVNSCCIPFDCLALQIGECLQIASGGKLEATPHRVIANKYPNYTRQQFVNFFIPKFDYLMSVPEGSTEEDVFACQSNEVPDLRVRWKNGMPYKELLDESWKFFK